MFNIRPVKFLLPGIFLLILGFGNLGVGLSKIEQHRIVLKELEGQQPLALNLENSSPLKRLQLAEQTAHRNFQRQQEAKDRMAFYNLVAFGGKIFIAFGLITILISGLKYRSVMQN